MKSEVHFADGTAMVVEEVSFVFADHVYLQGKHNKKRITIPVYNVKYHYEIIEDEDGK